MTGEKWVTIFMTNDEIDAMLKKGLLETEGIDCVVESNIYRPRSVAPLYNEFKLNVRVDDKPAAEEILKSIGDS